MPLCRALESQIHITIDGYYKPCCAFGKHDSAFPIDQYSPRDYLDSDFISNIKDQMKNGWHSGCKACELNEKNKKQSVRQTYNFLCRNVQDIELLDLNLNNDCNLSCRMCNSLASSKWEQLLKKTAGNKNNFAKIISKLPSVKHIKYQGGEPFITKEIEQVLNYIADNQCQFSFSTNCTLFPQKHLHLLDKAKFLFITLSIDGIGSTNDYIRHGKGWAVIDAVSKQWIEWSRTRKCFININTVVQAYNFHDLHNIKQFALDHGVRWNGLEISDIEEFTLNALPEKYIQMFLNSTSETFLSNYKFDNTLFKKLKETTAAHDKLLGRTLKDSNPVLYKFMCEVE